LTLKYDEAVSNFAFNFNVRRYTLVSLERMDLTLEEAEAHIEAGRLLRTSTRLTF